MTRLYFVNTHGWERSKFMNYSNPFLTQNCQVFGMLRLGFRRSGLVYKDTRSMTTTRKVDLCGIFPPIAMSFNADESIRYDHLEENLRRWNTIPFKGYAVHGSNGEFAYLSKEERIDILKHVKRFATDDKVIIAGAGCESTRDTIQLSSEMASAGADALLVITPCFYKSGMTNQALLQHYTKVADSSQAPIILYSVPANTGIDLSVEVITKLAAHPNVIGVKESGGDVAKIGLVVHQTKQHDFQVLAGSGSFFLSACTVGAVGAIAAIANVLGSEMCQLHQLFKDGKMEEAVRLQHRIIAPNGAVTRMFGVPGLKRSMEWFGYNGGPMRSPLQPLTSEQEALMRAAFKDNGFL
ncbi:4-hydroxy-2-oxoglutarate aldolase, mitochondrial-like [Anneissia japonica]|uniref:4-hydroxy-2-oxoglutarate aldolase, mitochondrial-like n=1 Tax=Anneissia japonica TaxID=1529436 RepID=UPI001425512D|nr:4-hydroxy-2-oxoglutarate aldolase, mitochondrial-like [Anneissia japonica]